MSTSISNALIDQFNLRIHDECVPRISKVLGMLSHDQIWYKHNAAANSIGHLILHLCGNVRQWVGHGIAGMDDIRTRKEEFATEDRLSSETLIDKLTGLRVTTDKAMSFIRADEDLLLPQKPQGYDETNLSILVHVTEHFSYHTGQIAIMAKWMINRDLGFYDGVDLDTVG